MYFGKIDWYKVILVRFDDDPVVFQALASIRSETQPCAIEGESYEEFAARIEDEENEELLAEYSMEKLNEEFACLKAARNEFAYPIND